MMLGCKYQIVTSMIERTFFIGGGVRGYDKVRSIVLLYVLLYQLMVYYNHLAGRPLRALKHMLRC